MVKMEKVDRVEAMKKAYDRFITVASRLSASRIHQSILLESNSAYNRFLAGVKEARKEGRSDK